MKELLDRGYGRATLLLEGGDRPLVVDFRSQGDPVILADDETPEEIEGQVTEIVFDDE